MKKFLSIIAAVGLTATASTAVVACGDKDKDELTNVSATMEFTPAEGVTGVDVNNEGTIEAPTFKDFKLDEIKNDKDALKADAKVEIKEETAKAKADTKVSKIKISKVKEAGVLTFELKGTSTDKDASEKVLGTLKITIVEVKEVSLNFVADTNKTVVSKDEALKLGLIEKDGDNFKLTSKEDLKTTVELAALTPDENENNATVIASQKLDKDFNVTLKIDTDKDLTNKDAIFTIGSNKLTIKGITLKNPENRAKDNGAKTAENLKNLGTLEISSKAMIDGDKDKKHTDNSIQQILETIIGSSIKNENFLNVQEIKDAMVAGSNILRQGSMAKVDNTDAVPADGNLTKVELNSTIIFTGEVIAYYHNEKGGELLNVHNNYSLTVKLVA